MGCKLYTSHYHDERPERRAELDFCLQANDSTFDRMFVITEAEQLEFSVSKNLDAITGPRPKFNYLLIAARVESDPGEIVVIANVDIVIPRCELAKICRNIQPNQVYALTRWEVSSTKGIHLWDVEYSQDAWVFRGTPKANIGGDYWFGTPGCDNRFAHELDAAGYEVLNPSRDIRTYHIHASQQRTETNTEAHRVPPPYMYIAPHHLGEQPTIKRADTWEQRKRVVAGRKVAAK